MADGQQLVRANLINNTKLEKLLQRIETIKEVKQRASEREEVKFELILTIFSVYRFLIAKLNFPHGKLSLWEFETAEEELKKLAQRQVNSFTGKFWSVLGRKTKWHFYLKTGFFPRRSRLFGRKVYCSYLRQRWNHLRSHSLLAHCQNYDHNTYPYTTPKNLTALYKALSKKRGLKEKFGPD